MSFNHAITHNAAMEMPTKVLLAGLGLATALAGSARFVTYRADSAVSNAIAACNAESDEFEKRIAKPNEPWLNDRLVCDEAEFYKPVEHRWIGTQKDIADAIAIRSADPTPEILYGVALLTAIFSAVPWTWYFMLRRLREVRDALVGR